jgi:aminoglycoside phosphotransferase (APT) family kinase protein
MDEQHVPTREEIKAILRTRPDFSRGQVNTALAKHSLGSVEELEVCPSYVPNVVLRVTTQYGLHLVFKIQFRSTWDWTLNQEYQTIRTLRESTDLPVPTTCILDADRDVLEYPFLIVSRMDGAATDELYKQSGSAMRRILARQLGEIQATIHGCPIDNQAGFPNLDLRDWPDLVLNLLFGDAALQTQLGRLCPEFEPQVREALESRSALAVTEEPVLVWRDGLFYNTVSTRSADTASISGIFDFQSAAISQRYVDHFKVSRALSAPSPEWSAFVEGYAESGGLSVSGDDSAVAQAFRVYGPAYQVRHFFDFLGTLHHATPNWLNEFVSALDTEVAEK